MDKLVSAVIPTYRRHSDIVIDAINSIKGQTYKNIEIIIVDDNGNDNKEYSEELYLALRNIDGVRYYRQEKNLGACFARNTGIELSNGDYIAFLDDDDCWKKDKIERQLPLFNNPDVGLAYCGTELIYPNGNRKQRKAVKKSNEVIHLLKHNYVGGTSCGIVRKDAIEAVGLFDTNLRSGQDQDMWIRLAQEYKIDCVEDCLVEYHIIEGQSISRNKQNRLFSNAYLSLKYKEYFDKNLSLRILMKLKIAKAYYVNDMKASAIKYLLTGKHNAEMEKKCEYWKSVV